MKNFQNLVSVHKFGGSSLANAERFRSIKQLLSGKNEVIVVSATQDTTSTLQQLLDLARSKQDFQSILQSLQQKHITIINEIVNKKNLAELIASLESDFNSIKNILNSVSLIGDYAANVQNYVLGFGELWSARILTNYLQQFSRAAFLDASQIITIFNKYNKVQIDWPVTEKALSAFLNHTDFDQLVVTGFIARDYKGNRTILGRNGSDYSAAIFAKLFRAKNLIIWTDVSGIYSADPRKVPSAFAIDQLSYEEALELAYFGASVIHPQTIGPAIENNIPIYIRNSFAPEAEGTCITTNTKKPQYSVRGLSSIEEVALINIEGSGLIGVSGIAARVFSVLHEANISVILISQASSEHSICFAVRSAEADIALEMLRERFSFELQQRQIEDIFIDRNCAILAVVGDGMVGRPGVAGRLCDTLSKANVNIRAIAQGSSERNISLVVNRQDINKALRAVHTGFYLSRKSLSIGLIGPGLVGGTLLKQIENNIERLREKYQVNLRVRGIMNSKQMLLDDREINLSQWQGQFSQCAQSADLNKFIDHLLADHIPHAAIIDCTANQIIAHNYLDFLRSGLHVITPNKRANSGDFAFYQNLQQLARDHNRFYLYETTVCAGLPVIKTLQDIVQTGDEVLEIEGVVSGTLAYIFYQLAHGKTFSEAVFQAKKLGYTEPDPRDDLSGMDVARKMVCLAREMGHMIHLTDVPVHNLVPEPLRSVSAEEFMLKLPQFDKQIAESLAEFVDQGKKPAYVGTIQQNGTVQVHIKAIPEHHPLHGIKGTDNMLVFRTQRYNDYPLIIQGPGAGAEVTAAGVFADLLRLVERIEA